MMVVLAMIMMVVVMMIMMVVVVMMIDHDNQDNISNAYLQSRLEHKENQVIQNYYTFQSLMRLMELYNELTMLSIQTC
jgi:hypothetical protein